MPSRDPEKRPKGLRALSALKVTGFKSKKNNNNNDSDPPSPQDDTVDVPDYLTAETIPPIPSDKQLPPRPPLPLNHTQRREVPPGTGPRNESLPAMNLSGFGPPSMPMQMPMGMGMDDGPMAAISRANGPMGSPAPENEPPMGGRFYSPMERPVEDVPFDRMPMPNGPMHRMPMDSGPMDRMPMHEQNRMPVSPMPRDDSPIDPIANEPSSMGTPRPPSGPMRPTPHEIPTSQVPRNSIQAATVPHAPQPIRPPSIPVFDRIPSDDSVPRVENNEDSIDTNIEAATDNEPTPTITQDNGPWMPPEVEPVAAPLNFLHYDCYQEHRSMPVAQNVWYPVPCMTCQKHDQEIRHRCVFCCLRICVGCFQTLQKCQRRSLHQLMESIQS